MQRIYLSGSLQGRFLINSMHIFITYKCIFFHYTTNCAALFSLTAKDYYWLFEFLNDTLLHMQTEVLTLQHLKCLKKVLKF